jgi:RNA 2',3'-cyclic 3'-phosphodiesterase
LRLFYAIWPDDHSREKLASISRNLNAGKVTPPENLHITLLFLGDIQDELKMAMLSGTDSIKCPKFALKLSQFGYFKRSGVFWLAPDNIPEELITLVNNLSELAVMNNIAVEDQPYLPHVTLARKIKTKIHLESQDFAMHVSKFILVESKTLPQGAKYRVLKTWPLT